ncbi:hypothetical protein D9M68_895930 [compost metagenome]
MPPSTPPTPVPGLENSKNRPYTPIIINSSATLGLVITASKRVRQSGAWLTTTASAVCSFASTPAAVKLLPSSCLSR